MSIITYTNCPVCTSNNIQNYIKVKDSSVSQQDFQLSNCKACGFIFTNPVPAANSIGQYYASEQYISHSDTKKGLINQLYHWVRSYTLSKKIALLNEVNKNNSKKLLDIGCGTGYFLVKALELNWSIEGYEPDETARKIANNKLNNKIHNSLSTITESGFDVITLWHVLEHVHELNATIEIIKSKISATGKVIIAVPNIESWDAKYYAETWAALDVPRHLYHFSKSSITLLLKKHGFVLEQTKGMIFDSFYVSMMSEKYKNNHKINFLGLIKALFIGLISNIKGLGKTNHSSLIYVFRKNE